METRFLTSASDLRRMISACPTCFKAILYGKHIISNAELPHIRLPMNKKAVFICNTTQFNAANPMKIGHWFLLFRLSSNSRSVYLCDSQMMASTIKSVMTNINSFCRNNNLTLVILNLPCQIDSSFKCGLLVSYFLQLVTHSKINHILALQALFGTNSVKTNEILALKQVQKHFKFKLSQFRS